MDRLDELETEVAMTVWFREALAPNHLPQALILRSENDIPAILDGKQKVVLRRVEERPEDVELKDPAIYINLFIMLEGEFERITFPRDKEAFFSEEKDYRAALKRFCDNEHFDWREDPDDFEQTCSNCWKKGTDMLPCAKCCMVCYCDDICRGLHTKQHSAICEEISRERGSRLHVVD